MSSVALLRGQRIHWPGLSSSRLEILFRYIEQKERGARSKSLLEHDGGRDSRCNPEDREQFIGKERVSYIFPCLVLSAIDFEFFNFQDLTRSSDDPIAYRCILALNLSIAQCPRQAHIQRWKASLALF